MSDVVAAEGEDRAVRRFMVEFKVLYHCFSFLKLASLDSISSFKYLNRDYRNL